MAINNPPGLSLPTTINTMIVDAMVANLRESLIVGVSNPDERADTVRAGKLQADPTKGSGITAMVWPADNGEPDSLYVPGEQKGVYGPTYTGSDGTLQIHRFEVGIRVFTKSRGDEGREYARERSHVVMARARYALRKMPMPQHPTLPQAEDDFSEAAILVQVRQWPGQEAGGTGMFIWSFKVLVEFLTEQNI